MSGERIWASSAVAGLLLLAALLIFPNLDDRRLWDDEAETALLAQNTLRFSVPIAWDGVSLVSQECGATTRTICGGRPLGCPSTSPRPPSRSSTPRPSPPAFRSPYWVSSRCLPCISSSRAGPSATG